jgi:hypothetical protein
MKTARIELHVTAFVHIGDDMTEALPAESVPVRMEDMTITRVVPINDSATCTESTNVHATVKAHTVSVIAAFAGVLPEKLAHAARNI